MAAFDAASRTKSLPVMPSRTSLKASINGGNYCQGMGENIHFEASFVILEDTD
jgi:hypothetical protein